MATDDKVPTDSQRIEIMKKIENIEFALSSLKSDVLHNPDVLKDRDVIVQSIHDNSEEIHKIIYDLGGFRK